MAYLLPTHDQFGNTKLNIDLINPCESCFFFLQVYDLWSKLLGEYYAKWSISISSSLLLARLAVRRPEKED